MYIHLPMMHCTSTMHIILYTRSLYSGSLYSGSLYSGPLYSGSHYSGSLYSGSHYYGSLYSGSHYSGPFYSGTCLIDCYTDRFWMSSVLHYHPVSSVANKGTAPVCSQGNHHHCTALYIQLPAHKLHTLIVSILTAKHSLRHPLPPPPSPTCHSHKSYIRVQYRYVYLSHVDDSFTHIRLSWMFFMCHIIQSE